MAEAITVSTQISGTDKTLSFEAGKLAGLANGAVTARIGNTQVLVTATASSKPRDGADFFPLTVDIEERMYAAGRIPGSFFRREGRASEDAILTCRLIDRPLRPNFPSKYRHDTHVVGTILGVDGENPYDVVALNGASAALWTSDIPFESPVAAVRLAWSVDGTWIPFPTFEQGEASTFEMVVAGRQLDSGEVAVMMVEAGGTEKSFDYFAEGAPKVTEEVLASGLEASKQWIDDIVELQKSLRTALGDPGTMNWIESSDYSDEVLDRVREVAAPRLTEVMSIADKADRDLAQSEVTAAVKAELETEMAEVANGAKQVSGAIRAITKEIVRRRIVENGFRIDGRATNEVRELSSEVGFLPTAHGSALFQRGETQVLNVTTLGMSRMEQLIDTLNPTNRKRYMHHYNFPPFSTGEAGFMRGPKRREIGHGALAERALIPVIPSKEEFPYALRLVSDALSSNGSTSMGSVCASSLSLMDAGVPIKAAVSGIAMGLVHADGKYTTLTDILGAEDAFGDMDFKVAGTADTITALQLDTKIEGIPADVLANALQQARDARMQILEVMAGAIAEPRADVGASAPKIVSFEIPIDKIGEVIGPRGKVINQIQEETGADISVDDDGTVGTVAISAVDRAVVDEAERQIRLIINPPTANVGEVYDGRVVNITKFGAFVNILPGTDGLLHISKIGGGKRIDKVEDVLSLGDVVPVKVDDIDPNGKLSLSLAGDAPAPTPAAAASPSDDSAAKPLAAEKSTDNASEESEPAQAEVVADDAVSSADSADRVDVNFGESFDAKAAEQFGDLGPAPAGGGGQRRRRRRR
ncbi:MAG: polyribonucleotide nucleotidyltransferase [Actinobacteria bacterium]|nr:polyribonucleotide nucleotidyltransferase [Actinomycetota bacterium]